jgi:hypothetical protein
MFGHAGLGMLICRDEYGAANAGTSYITLTIAGGAFAITGLSLLREISASDGGELPILIYEDRWIRNWLSQK